jgi:hypothetical protein
MQREKQKYYCGAWWVPKFIRRILSFKFNASCKIHDLDYGSKEFDREETDKRFLCHMIRQSKNNIFYEVLAAFFYISVRLLGKLSWGKNENDK